MSKNPAQTSSGRKAAKSKGSKSSPTATQPGSGSKPASARIAVVVLGMHRSGTSALAGTLHLMGCDTPATPMLTTMENEKGYFESALICKEHEALLASAGTRWDDWLAINPDWYSSIRAEEYHDRTVELIRGEFGESRLFVLKDPRLCRLVPFWENALSECGVEPRYVLTHRNPIEVINSLAYREDLDPGLGMLIWLRHVLDAEADTRGKLRCFVSYDGLLANWVGTMERLQEGIALKLPRLSVGVRSEVETFLDIDLRHHAKPSNQALESPFMSDWVKDVFAILEKWSAGKEDKADYKTLDTVRRALDSVAITFDPLVQTNREVFLTRKALAELEQTNAQLQLDQSNVQAELAQTTSALEQRSHEAEQTHSAMQALKNEQIERERELERQTQEAENLRHELQSLMSEKAEVDRSFAESRSALDDARQAHDLEITALKQRMQEQEQDALAKEAELKIRGDLAEEAVETIRNSTSWRLTRSLRWLGSLRRN